MTAFFVILLIVAHRFLRFDLVNDTVAGLHLRGILMGALVLAVAHGMLMRTVRLRATVHLIIQYLLWLWAGISRLVADGTGQVVGFLKDDYTKDVVFATLVSTLCDSLRKLRALSWVLVAVMTLICLVAIPQHGGVRKCYHYSPTSNVLNYEQTPDGRQCLAAADCFDVPRGEEHLRGENWACEHEGVWGLATVVDRVHYVGNLMDPNGLALALVMAAALALGLLTWPAEGTAPLPRIPRLLLLIALGIMGVTLYYAASRAGQVAMGLVVLSFLYTRIGLVGVALAGIGVAPLLLLSNRNAQEAAYSTLTRIQTQLNGYQAFLDRPVFGVGYGNYGQISFITAHNSMMLTAVETGVLGGGLFLLGGYTALKFLWQVSRVDPDDFEVDDPTVRREPLDMRVITDLRHFARTLLVMLLGVAFCVAFLSMAFDVMWLFPLGIVSAFYGVVRDELPEYELHLSLVEVLGAIILGGALPAVTAALLSR